MKLQNKLYIMVIIGVFALNTIQISHSLAITASQNKNSNLEQQGVVFNNLLIDATVHETFVDSNISLVMENSQNDTILSEFTFFIPDGAYITNLSMTVNGHSFWGDINRIVIAQQIFENATQQGKSALLLTQIGQNEYNLSFAIAKLSKVMVSVYYFQRLIRVGDQYTLNINYPKLLIFTPRQWSTKIHLQSPLRSITNVYAPSIYDKNPISSNLFDISSSGDPSTFPNGIKHSITYSLDGKNLGSNIYTYSNGTDEYFYSSFTPVLENVGSQIPKDFVFVLDVSGSMDGTKLDQAKAAILDILDNLYIDDRVGIVKFSTDVSSAKSYLVNKDSSTEITSLKGWVSNLASESSTDILTGLKKGVDLFDTSSRPKILVLLTDGNPTAGVTSVSEIETQFFNYNTEKGVSLYALGFGSDVDFTFLQRMARNNNGEGVQIPVNDNSLEALQNFYNVISTPLITDLKVTVNSGVQGTIYPYFLPNIYAGSELFLVGKRSGTIDIDLTGQTATKSGSWKILYTQNSSTDKSDSWVANLWAVTVINDLLTQIKYTTGNKTPLIEQVVEIALNFGIVTPYTAITVVVPDLDTLVDGKLSNATSTSQGTYYTTAYASFNQPNRSYGSAESPGFELFVTFISLATCIAVFKKKKSIKE